MNNETGLAAAAGKQHPQIDLHRIKHMSDPEVLALKPSVLHALYKQAEDDLRRSKLVKDWLHGLLVRKYEDQAKQLRDQQGKDTGTVRMDDDGIVIISDLPKKIEWDQKKLAPLIEKLVAEGWNIQQLARVEYKVSERQFNELPSGVRGQFEDARTIKLGKHSFKLEDPAEKDNSKKEGDQ